MMERGLSLIGATLLALSAFPDQSAAGERLCPARIVMHADGSVSVDRHTYNKREEKRAALLRYRKTQPDCAPNVLADRGVRTRDMAEFANLLLEVGFVRVGILTEPRDMP